MIRKAISLLILLFGVVPVAHGYIDPGSGLLLIQGLLAFIGGAIVFVKHPIRSAKRLLERLRNRRDA